MREPAVWLPVTAAIAFWCAVAVAGARITEIGPWYRALRQPWWKPRDALFGPIWTTVFLCAGTGCVIAWRGGGTPGERQAFLLACLVNGVGNVWWSWLFFRRRRPDWALRQVVPFWLTVLLMYWTTRPLAYAAGIWFAPYLGWVAIATYLNWTVVRLNGPFDAR